MLRGCAPSGASSGRLHHNPFLRPTGRTFLKRCRHICVAAVFQFKAMTNPDNLFAKYTVTS